MSAPLHDTAKLRVGTVVQIAVELTDKTGQPYWWKRFAVVTDIHNIFRFTALTLKLNPDFDKDVRDIGLYDDDTDRRQVVTILPEPWPQGVAAMHMKGLALRWFSPEAED